MLRHLRRLVALGGLILAVSLGCDAQQLGLHPTGTGTAPARPATPAVAAAPGETIKIASFNIQVFGESKLAKTEVMSVLVDVVRRFDVVAVQELRAKDQSVMPRFVQMINAQGARYDFVAGPRLGRSNSKEQYVYLFDTQRIEVDSNSVYTVSDPDDLLHREPLVARFRVRGLPLEQAFSFKLVNIHTDPDEVAAELAALDDVFNAVRNDGGQEDDVILLGDLNAGYPKLGDLGRLPNFACVIHGEPTNTRLSQSYDNLVFDQTATVEFTGQAGIINLRTAYGLTEAQALEISDHLPIWGEFSVYENRGLNVAGRPQPPVR